MNTIFSEVPVAQNHIRRDFLSCFLFKKCIDSLSADNIDSAKTGKTELKLQGPNWESCVVTQKKFQ